MTFEEKYLEWKKEGLKDREIASLLTVCPATLKRIKSIHGIGGLSRTRSNAQGLTEEHLRIAVENGISRRLALRRRREYHWTIDDAIHVPKSVRKEYFGVSKHQRILMESERQHGYYLKRKERMIEE